MTVFGLSNQSNIYRSSIDKDIIVGYDQEDSSLPSKKTIYFFYFFSKNKIVRVCDG